ncbi:MAG: zinc metalloprotease HtpX [Legionella sp.]|nr:zinc metalloprotease HtpX [Legionella sp.]
MSLQDYHAVTTDWREQIRANKRKTNFVIGSFIFIYVCIGIIIDSLVLHSMYPQVPLGTCFYAVMTLKVVPFASLLLAGFALISLWITYALYDKIMLMGTEYHEITPETSQSLQERQLYNVVEEMKVASGLQYMPRVFIIEAEYMNAFASGYSERSAMVAITRGLMEKLDRAEMQAVMAHELSHIRHFDIKLTLMVAVLSNILLIVVDVLFYTLMFKRDNKGDNRLLLIITVLRWVLPIITILLTLFLSRTREYMADAGCVELMRDNEPMARALLKISDDHTKNAEQYTQAYGATPHEEVRQASYLFDPTDIDPVKSLTSAFSTHPSVMNRLEALGFKRKSS